MADYELSGPARQDIERIYRYTVRAFGEAVADRYAAELQRAAEATAVFPAIGRPHIARSGTECRRYDCGRHALFYRLEGETTVILRILHLAMDFDRHL